MKFPNGSIIKFGYCNKERDLNQYQGAEYDVIFVDEATQIQEDWLKKITACMRGVNNFPKRTYYTCNPGGPSHGYIKRLFIERQFKGEEKPENYTFIQAKVQDNHALMEAQPDYLDQLKALPPKLRKAWLEGSFDIYEGQFFEEWCDDPEHYADRRWTHVINPINVRPHWPIYRSFDWGYRRPFSMGYYTIDDDGVMFRICEYYGVRKEDGESLPNEGLKWAPERVFAVIQQFENEHPLLAGRQIHGVADPAIWDAEGGISYAETAMKYGIYFEKGDHKRIPGWMQCHYRLMFDENGYSNFYCFNTCKEFIRTIPKLEYDEHVIEDLNTEGEDHIADEWRYFCMSRPITPVIDPEVYVPKWGADPLEQIGGKNDRHRR